MLKLLITGLLFLVSLNSFAKPLAQEGFYVFDSDKTHLNSLVKQYDLIIDHLDQFGYEVYGPIGLKTWLETLGADFKPLNMETEKGIRFGQYPSHKKITKQLKDLQAKYPQILQLQTIGQSVKGEELWVMKISDNVAVDEKEPEFKYIANMHGDEIIGRDMMVMFIEDLAKNYATDEKITKLINTTEIYIMPTMNPDGAAKKRRANANWIDLNRDFPDFTTTDNQNTGSGRAVETMALMKFQAERHFSLSANFHGGSVCVNYPWDTTDEDHPLQNLIKDFSITYAETNLPMSNSYRFDQGVVRGYDWYEVNGGMQDWSFHWHGDLQVTIELSQSKWPNYKLLKRYYSENRESLVNYLSLIQQGAGFSFDSKNSGSVKIYNHSKVTPFLGEFSFWNGEFYKILPDGEYTFKIETQSGKIVEKSFNVSKNTPVEMVQINSAI